MLLAIHILFGVAALVANGATIISNLRGVKSQYVQAGVATTVISVVTGIGLVFTGAGLVRVCAEAFVLIAVAACAVFSARSTTSASE